MSLHLIKLCVGISSVEELEAYRTSRGRHSAGFDHEIHVHRTRMMPRRGGEIIGEGSLYWVIRGKIQCRQIIVGLEASTDADGKSCCDIQMLTQIVRTVPQPKRPFQGWRYLPGKDAPADLDLGVNTENDLQIANELARLGLI